MDLLPKMYLVWSASRIAASQVGVQIHVPYKEEKTLPSMGLHFFTCG